MKTSTGELLYHLWYVAMHGSEIARGKTISKTLLGHQILLGRDNDGVVFALRDFCPHRGIPLRYGQFDGKEIECCYHGWKFNTGGQCTAIPCLPEDDSKTDISRIKAYRYPCIEQNGLIWVYVPKLGERLPEVIPPLESLPVDLPLAHVETVLLPCNVDQAVIGLMDPSHGPFVHKSWWWRSQKSIHLKSKLFAPYKMGFCMKSHKPSSNSRAYKILGGERSTEIAFQLPSLRSEHIKIGDKNIYLLTALTPIDEDNTSLQQYVATDMRLVKTLMPLLKHFGRKFIAQDVDIVKKQQEGLTDGHAPLLLLGDADQQALWYYKLKKDFLSAQAEGREFENRIPEKTLRWRS